MKKFLLIIFGTGEGVAALDEKTQKVHMEKWYKWDKELTEKGIKVHGEALSSEAKVIKGKEKLIKDGLYVGTQKEFAVGGYYIIEAKSIEQAIEIAKGCPTFELDGVVEVREIMEM